MMLDVVKQAILDRRCLTARHKGTERRFAPHALGLTSRGVPAVLAFQYAGTTTTSLPRGGDWRCFHLDELSEVHANDDRWRSWSNYDLTRQACLAEIVVAVPDRTTSS